MDDVHGAHGTTSVVKDPFLVEVDVGGMQAVELGHDVVDDGARVVSMGGDGALGEVVQVLVVKDVELFQVLLEEHVDGGQETDPQRQCKQAPERRHCDLRESPRVRLEIPKCKERGRNVVVQLADLCTVRENEEGAHGKVFCDGSTGEMGLRRLR